MKKNERERDSDRGWKSMSKREREGDKAQENIKESMWNIREQDRKKEWYWEKECKSER